MKKNKCQTSLFRPTHIIHKIFDKNNAAITTNQFMLGLLFMN